MRILVIEDDPHTLSGIEDALSIEGYEVTTARNGLEGLERFSEVRPDMVCLDIMMPGMDGYSFCRRIRENGFDAPVIFISAKGEEIDKVVGLELGADDFLVKPFGVRELVARIRSVARRCLACRKTAESSPPAGLTASRPRSGLDDGPSTDRCAAGKSASSLGEPFSMENLGVIPDELRARRGNETIDLSPREVKILALFHASPGKVLTREQIFDAAWGEEHIPGSRTLDQQISQLRKKIEIDPRNPKLISTVHGAGYRYEP